MLAPIHWDSMNTIVELGAGTGVLTHYIHERIHSESKAIIFELDQPMRQRLADLYPGLHFRSNAADLGYVVQEMGLVEADFILSGLPFANFNQSLRNSILEGVLGSLKPGGIFITFQYSLQMKKQFEECFKR